MPTDTQRIDPPNTKHCERRRRPPSPRLLLGIVGLSLASLGTIHSARAESYHLVTQDKIRLRIVEWRPGEGVYKNWEALNGDFAVNQSGSVSIPLIGEVPAVGLTTEDLAVKIGLGLQQRAGLASRPFISVEVAQYGPIYLAGGVSAPGQYPYSPDLTVMKAISLAGGLQRVGDGDRGRINRDRIQATGTFGDAQVEYNNLLMREARLRAEMEGKDSFEIPAVLNKTDGAQDIHAEEMNLMKFRRVEIDSKIAAAQDLDALYATSIATLQNKITSQQHQVSQFDKQLTTVATLVDKGLTVSSRQFELDRAQSDAESKLLDLEFQLVQSRQSLEENKRDEAAIVNAMNSKIQEELSKTVQDIAKANLQMGVSQAMLRETADESRRLGDMEANAAQQPKFTIARQTDDGQTDRFEAMPDTPVKPRDLIEVDLVPTN